jgi:hypothetical protein
MISQLANPTVTYSDAVDEGKRNNYKREEQHCHYFKYPSTTF